MSSWFQQKGCSVLVSAKATFDQHRARPLTWRPAVRATAKRAFDVAGAAFLLLVLLPLLLTAALAVKLDSRGPVLFRQRRTGWRGQEFQMLKLRTMRVG